ncbi:MAG: LLM class flavin-dependent oxidoreductase [Halobacteriales archaeon]|nr:LLM class flavin-dependent oxidoreductase [Halobacteriales archaeon]
MERGLLIQSDPARDWRSMAATAVASGYDALWTGELWGADAFVRLAALAMEYPSVQLGTGIVNVYSRSPAVLASATATVNELSDQPVILGTGVTTPKAVEDLHGGTFDRPVTRAAEALRVIHGFLSNTRSVEFEGEVYSVADFPGLDADLPVYHAALGRKNREVVGRYADGWIPHNVPFARLASEFEVIADAARAADRDPASIAVVPYVPAVVDSDPERARAAMRRHLAYYVGSARGYERAVATQFPEQAAAIADAWRSGKRDVARAAVTDAMVEALGVAGTPETAGAQFDSLVPQDVVDHAIVVVPAGVEEPAISRTIEALAP